MPRTRIEKKHADPTPLAERLLDMPLARKRAAKSVLTLADGGAAYLTLNNLEAPLTWRLGLGRTSKAEAADLLDALGPDGSRHLNAMAEPDAVAAEPAEDFTPPAQSLGVTGSTEFGLQTDGDHEYFVSKFGDLAGIIRIKRKDGGAWSAQLAKSNIPRVLSPEAVSAGLMPPEGSSALPKSLEAVVPAEYQYWKARGDEARAMRDALVDATFFTDDTLKIVDGELRKVEVKYYTYEPDGSLGKVAKAARPTLAARLASVCPPALLAKSYSPMADENADWLEVLDSSDTRGALAILSPIDNSITPRQMVRAVASLKGDYVLEHDDTRAAQHAFAKAGVVFKLAGAPGRLFCASFPVGKRGAVSWLAKTDGPVAKTVDFQGIKILIDRPEGFIQKGQAPDGSEWERVYTTDYGYIAGTLGGDGDSLDVFVGPNLESSRVFWVTQKKFSGGFDEFKLFVGFDSPRAAQAVYAEHIPPQLYDGMAETSVKMLKALLGLDPADIEKRMAPLRKDYSLDKMRQAVGRAVDAAYPPPDAGDGMVGCGNWIQECFADSAVYSQGYDAGKSFRVGYSYDPASDTATLTGTPVAVVSQWVPAEQAGAKPAAPAPTTTTDADGAAAEDVEAAKLAKVAKMKVVKAGPVAGEERYAFGIVLEPDIVDSQGDTYDAPTIRIAAEKFMEFYGNTGLMHREMVNDKVKILESYIAPVEFEAGGITVKKGTWLMAVRVVDDQLWDLVKGAGLTGFSIGGSAIRAPLA